MFGIILALRPTELRMRCTYIKALRSEGLASGLAGCKSLKWERRCAKNVAWRVGRFYPAVCLQSWRSEFALMVVVGSFISRASTMTPPPGAGDQANYSPSDSRAPAELVLVNAQGSCKR